VTKVAPDTAFEISLTVHAGKIHAVILLLKMPDKSQQAYFLH
jgi:hypothetical protein